MALLYILQIFQVSGLIEDSWSLISALHLIYCDMLFWMKHMKKIWPQLHLHRYVFGKRKTFESVLGASSAPCTILWEHLVIWCKKKKRNQNKNKETLKKYN